MFQTVDNVRWQEQEEGIFFVYQGQDGFEANDVAVRILELCRQPQKRDDIIKSILEEYDIDEEMVVCDVDNMIAQFQEIGIIKEI